MTDSLLTLDDLRAKTKVSKSTLYKLCEAGRLPAAKIGNSWRIRASDFDAWLTKQITQRRTLLTALALALLLSYVPVFAASQPVMSAQRAEAAPGRVRGVATYYTATSCRAEGNSGVYTASGARYDESALTLALPHRAFGGWYRICRSDVPGRCVVAQHTDFGPGRGPRSKGVVADLSPAVYDVLGGRRGVTRRGVAWGQVNVVVEPLS